MATLNETIAKRKERKALANANAQLPPELIDPVAAAIASRIMAEEMPKIRAKLTADLTTLAEREVKRIAALEVRGPKGDQGAPGKAGPPPIAGVHYRLPQDGKDADEKAIVARVMKAIRMPRDGSDGRDGANAAVDYELIVQEAMDRLRAKGIEPEHINGLTDMLAKWASSVQKTGSKGLLRGGGDIITAGTGITVTVDANGKRVISLSSISGFTTLLPTETPNGALTTFTFATATAKPSFMVSDNVWMRATTKSGTVNWTWNAGTLQATLAIPPQDELFAVV